MSEPAEQGHVPAGKVEMVEVLDLQRLAGFAEIDFVPGRAGGGDGGDLGERELALGEDVEDLAPDIAGRADHDNPIAHGQYHS